MIMASLSKYGGPVLVIVKITRHFKLRPTFTDPALACVQTLLNGGYGTGTDGSGPCMAART
jgi:hypothetical protein